MTIRELFPTTGPRGSGTRARVVVLGGGYAGQLAAQALAARTDAAVTLVNDGDRFTQRVRLHEAAAGGEPAAAPRYTELLAGTGVAFLDDRAEDLDLAARRVRLRDGGSLDYDLLVYALGSHADPAALPGPVEDVSTAAGAARLQERLAAGPTRVAVVGAGLTGLELATELGEQGHPVTLVTAGDLGADLSARGARHVRRVCARLGVTVREHARAVAADDDGLALADGTRVAADVVVGTVGFAVPDLAFRAGLAVDDHARVLVGPDLRSTSHPDVLAIGDAAAATRPDGQLLRMACATGLPQAQQAARTVAALLAGTTPEPLRFRYAVRCVSLGRRDGLIQLVHADDSPREAVLTGRLAAAVKEAVVVNALRVQRHPWIPTSA